MEGMTKAKPSTVFLQMLQTLTIADPEMPPEEFRAYAEAWRQIVQMEEATRSAAVSAALARLAGEPVTLVPAPAETPKAVTYDCASAPMPDAEVQKAMAAAAAKTEAGKQSLITRKRKLLEALDALRARGVSMAEITAAGAGLTINDVLDALDRKPLPLPKLAALEKAAGKLNKEADAGD